MPRLALAVVVGLLLVMGARPAGAWLVELATTMSVEEARDPVRFRAAVTAAAEAVVVEAGVAPPTLVVVTAAIVLRDRVHVRVLLADREGEEAIGGRAADDAPRDATDPIPDSISGI